MMPLLVFKPQESGREIAMIGNVAVGVVEGDSFHAHWIDHLTPATMISPRPNKSPNLAAARIALYQRLGDLFAAMHLQQLEMTIGATPAQPRRDRG